MRTSEFIASWSEVPGGLGTSKLWLISEVKVVLWDPCHSLVQFAPAWVVVVRRHCFEHVKSDSTMDEGIV